MLLVYIFLVIHTVLANNIQHQRNGKVIYNIDDAEFHFESFIITYNKSYHDEQEKASRFQIFKENLRNINARNMKEQASFEINQFADLTTEEFVRKHTGFRPDLVTDGGCGSQNALNIVNYGDTPASFDWRDQINLQVKNQQSCGSCWAFAATGNVEAMYAIKNQQTVSLSEQQLVDCDTSSNGCQGGWPSGAFSYLIQAGGQESESAYPYKNAQQQCQFSPDQVAATLSSCINFQVDSEDSMKEIVYKYPVTAIVDASTWGSYRGGVLTNCQGQGLDHAIMVVGYGTDSAQGDFWVIKNSWGASWGESGYIRIQRGVNACGIFNQYMSSAVL